MKNIFILAVMGLLLAFTGGAAGAVVGAELEEGMDMVITSIDEEDMDYCEEGYPIVTPEADAELGEGTVRIISEDGDDIVVELYDTEGDQLEVGTEEDRDWLPIYAGIGGIVLAGGIALTIRKKK